MFTWAVGLLFFVLVLVLAVPAADAVSIRPVGRTQHVLFCFVSTKMLPLVAVIVPICVVAGRIARKQLVRGLSMGATK